MEINIIRGMFKYSYNCMNTLIFVCIPVALIMVNVFFSSNTNLAF